MERKIRKDGGTQTDFWNEEAHDCCFWQRGEQLNYQRDGGGYRYFLSTNSKKLALFYLDYAQICLQISAFIWKELGP